MPTSYNNKEIRAVRLVDAPEGMLVLGFGLQARDRLELTAFALFALASLATRRAPPLSALRSHLSISSLMSTLNTDLFALMDTFLLLHFFLFRYDLLFIQRNVFTLLTLAFYTKRSLCLNIRKFTTDLEGLNCYNYVRKYHANGNDYY